MVKIHEFDPVLYPFKLWVSLFNDEEDDVKAYDERFKDGHNGKPMQSEVILKNDGITYWVCEQDSNVKKGALIVINGKEAGTMKVIAHEATHAARFAWDFLGESPTGEEADAYLVGWIAKCVEEIVNMDG